MCLGSVAPQVLRNSRRLRNHPEEKPVSGNIIGRILLNQFRVDAFVASGGMGTVYRVWDLKRNVSLAMKVLHADLAEDPSVLKRFKREANALQRLAHPNIVPFYGMYQTSEFSFLVEQ